MAKPYDGYWGKMAALVGEVSPENRKAIEAALDKLERRPAGERAGVAKRKSALAKKLGLSEHDLHIEWGKVQAYRRHARRKAGWSASEAIGGDGPGTDPGRSKPSAKQAKAELADDIWPEKTEVESKEKIKARQAAARRKAKKKAKGKKAKVKKITSEELTDAGARRGAAPDLEQRVDAPSEELDRRLGGGEKDSRIRGKFNRKSRPISVDRDLAAQVEAQRVNRTARNNMLREAQQKAGRTLPEPHRPPSAGSRAAAAARRGAGMASKVGGPAGAFATGMLLPSNTDEGGPMPFDETMLGRGLDFALNPMQGKLGAKAAQAISLFGDEPINPEEYGTEEGQIDPWIESKRAKWRSSPLLDLEPLTGGDSIPVAMGPGDAVPIGMDEYELRRAGINPEDAVDILLADGPPEVEEEIDDPEFMVEVGEPDFAANTASRGFEVGAPEIHERLEIGDHIELLMRPRRRR